MRVRSVNDIGIEEAICNNSRPVMVCFWAPGSNAWKRFNPILDDIAVGLDDSVVVVKINSLEHPGMSDHLVIGSIPTIILFQDGPETARWKGLHSLNKILGDMDEIMKRKGGS